MNSEPSTRWLRCQAYPLWMCGMRPFFLAAAIAACMVMALWTVSLSGQAQVVHWLNAMPGGPIVWHAQELLLGYVGAAVVGFLIVSVPEFTQTTAIRRRYSIALLVCWLIARVCAAIAPLLPLWVAVCLSGFANGAVGWGVTALIAPRILRQTGRPHLGFMVALIALLFTQAGFFLALGRQAHALAWLYAMVGMLMVLFLVAASRISMRIMNSRIVNGMLHQPWSVAPLYVARPPRRNVAIVAIVMSTAAEFFHAPDAVTGWLNFATAAAVVNITNDWHVGRPLYNRWAGMLYACYWLLAIGYVMIGLSYLGAAWAVSAGRHVLMIGVMGLSIVVVMCIAGRQHCGFALDLRLWVPTAAFLLVLSMLCRLFSALAYSTYSAYGLWVSGSLWIVAHLLFVVFMGPVLWGDRPDGQRGCAQPQGGHGQGCGVGLR